jgi:hypothetical protein
MGSNIAYLLSPHKCLLQKETKSKRSTKRGGARLNEERKEQKIDVKMYEV